MKLLTSGLVIVFGCIMVISLVDAKGPPTEAGSNSNANSRAKVRPQIGLKRLSSQASPRASSHAPGRGKSMSRVMPTHRLAKRQKGNQHTNSNATNPDGRPLSSRGFAKDSPRIAMTRSFNKRLSQIDKIRDKALEIGDLGLLDLADELELRARRKFDDMIARMDQRRELGKPGVGPPVLLPAVDPDPVPETPVADQPTEPTALPEIETPDQPELADTDSSDAETAAEPEAESESAEE